MLWSYTLVWTHDREAQEIRDLRWIEEHVAGDARSTHEWELLSQVRLTSKDLGDKANEQWCFPTVDGEEVVASFYGIPVEEDHHSPQEESSAPTLGLARERSPRSQSNWLQTITAGALVIVDRGAHRDVVRHVQRVTPTQVLVDGVRYRRSDGFVVGAQSYHKSMLRPCPPEAVQPLRWREAQEHFVQVCRGLTVPAVAHLSPEQCQALLAQIHPKHED
jgi:hypothetical protein